MNAALLADARRELGQMPSVLESLLGGLDAEGARTRPAPAEWSPVEIVCHLRDEETEDFGARLRVILSGADNFVRIDPRAMGRRAALPRGEPSGGSGGISRAA